MRNSEWAVDVQKGNACALSIPAVQFPRPAVFFRKSFPLSVPGIRPAICFFPEAQNETTSYLSNSLIPSTGQKTAVCLTCPENWCRSPGSRRCLSSPGLPGSSLEWTGLYFPRLLSKLAHQQRSCEKLLYRPVWRLSEKETGRKRPDPANPAHNTNCTQ